jgi:hypothetical protein
MKHKNFVLSFIALAFCFSASAQKGLTKIDINYNVAVPMGSFKQHLDETSFRGFKASILHGISDRVSIGLGTGFQDFYQKYPRQLYQLSDGSHVSAVVTNSIQTMPVLFQAKYALSPASNVQPYVGLGVGANFITYTQLLGEFGGQDTKFGFAARPEAGFYIPFKKGGESGFVLGATYNIMPFKELGFENLNHLGVHAGLSLPLRK